MRRFPTLALASAIAGLAGTAAASSAAELVQDGSFEAGIGASAWQQSDVFVGRNLWPTGTPLCATAGPAACRDNYTDPATLKPANRALPRSGSWWAWFGGYNIFNSILGLLDPRLHTSSLRQNVTIAPGTPATLSFWLWLGRSDASSVLNVSLGGTMLFAVRGDDPRYKQGYTQVVVPVDGSIASGAPQTLSFDYTGAVTLLQFPVVNVDDVSLQVPQSDLGVGLSSSPTTVTRGSTFTTQLSAGNTGPHDADDVQVEYPMPTGATMLGVAGEAACSAPQTAPGYVMHCNFGTLPAGATRAVTVTLRADAVGTVAQSAAMPQRSGDPNPANQLAHSAVTVVAPPADAPPREEPPTCTAPRRFTVPLARGRKGSGLMLGSHRPASSRITSARLTGPRKFKAVRLSHTRSRVTIDLRRAPAGKYTVRTRVRVAKKRTISVNKTYTACGATRASINAAQRAAAKSKSSAKAKKSAKADSSSRKRR